MLWDGQLDNARFIEKKSQVNLAIISFSKFTGEYQILV